MSDKNDKYEMVRVPSLLAAIYRRRDLLAWPLKALILTAFPISVLLGANLYNHAPSWSYIVAIVVTYGLLLAKNWTCAYRPIDAIINTFDKLVTWTGIPVATLWLMLAEAPDLQKITIALITGGVTVFQTMRAASRHEERKNERISRTYKPGTTAEAKIRAEALQDLLNDLITKLSEASTAEGDSVEKQQALEKAKAQLAAKLKEVEPARAAFENEAGSTQILEALTRIVDLPEAEDELTASIVAATAKKNGGSGHKES